MKRLMLLTLLLATLAATSTAAEKSSLSMTSGGGQKTYSETEVSALLDAVRAEAAAAIERAWDDGYKAGVLAYAPEAEGLRVMNESLRAESARLSVPAWHVSVWTAAGLALGFGAGFIIRSVQ